MLNPMQILAFTPRQGRLVGYQRVQGNVRFGSKADLCSAKGHVRFTPKADMCGATRDVRFVPIADSCTATNSTLFDHLGAREQRRRNFEAECTGGL